MEKDLNNKFKEIENDYNEYYDNSNFIKEMKKIVINVLSNNKEGLTIDEIDSLIDYKNKNFTKIINVKIAVELLLKDNVISKNVINNTEVYSLK